MKGPRPCMRTRMSLAFSRLVSTRLAPLSDESVRSARCMSERSNVAKLRSRPRSEKARLAAGLAVRHEILVHDNEIARKEAGRTPRPVVDLAFEQDCGRCKGRSSARAGRKGARHAAESLVGHRRGHRLDSNRAGGRSIRPARSRSRPRRPSRRSLQTTPRICGGSSLAPASRCPDRPFRATTGTRTCPRR